MSATKHYHFTHISRLLITIHCNQRLEKFAQFCGSYSAMNGLELAKKSASYRAVDDFVQNGYAIGIGSGSTIVYAIQRLAERVRSGLSVRCVPTSFQVINRYFSKSKL